MKERGCLGTDKVELTIECPIKNILLEQCVLDDGDNECATTPSPTQTCFPASSQTELGQILSARSREEWSIELSGSGANIESNAV